MGVRILEGTYDGTEQGAVMVDSTNLSAVGPVWTGPEAVEQVEAFQDWLRREPWLRDEVFAELGLELADVPGPLARAHDPRAWPEAGLARLIAYWRKTFLVDGRLPEPVEG